MLRRNFRLKVCLPGISMLAFRIAPCPSFICLRQDAPLGKKVRSRALSTDYLYFRFKNLGDKHEQEAS